MDLQVNQRSRVQAEIWRLSSSVCLFFFPAHFGPPLTAMSIILGPLLDRFYQLINPSNLLVTWATARVCSHIFVEWFTQARSQTKEPPLPGVTTSILLHTPATMKDPSVAPGFGMIFPGTALKLAAFWNIASTIAVGMVVIPLFFASMVRDGGVSMGAVSIGSCRLFLP